MEMAKTKIQKTLMNAFPYRKHGDAYKDASGILLLGLSTNFIL